MQPKRIIPCLDIRNGKTVKGVNFVNIKEVGDPVEMALKYEADGADELVLLDIAATVEGRKTFVDLVEKVAANLNIPFAVGGGISEPGDVEKLLHAGAAKVSINSAAVKNPQLINELAKQFGSAVLVVAIDARNDEANRWAVTVSGGNVISDKELFSWAKEVEERGAGEILFTSMNHDGTKNGFACTTLSRLADLLNIPVIASGGAGTKEHFLDAFTKGKADAALAASVFHYNEIPIPELKSYLRNHGILVR
jgi:cyclase